MSDSSTASPPAAGDDAPLSTGVPAAATTAYKELWRRSRQVGQNLTEDDHGADLPTQADSLFQQPQTRHEGLYEGFDVIGLATLRILPVVHAYQTDPVGWDGQGTGVLIEHHKQVFLLTNRHMVCPEQYHAAVSPTAATPPQPKFMRVFHLSANDSQARIPVHEPLFNHNGTPRWQEWREADVAALPLSLHPSHSVEMPLHLDTYKLNVPLYAGMPLTIVGFTLGLDAAKFPVWKSGWLACDPHQHALPKDDGNHGVYYIDATTRGGSSGSPVFLRFDRPKITGRLVSIQPKSHFLGLYSGRRKAASWTPELDGHSDLEPNIGVVWPVEIIERVLDQPPSEVAFVALKPPAAEQSTSPEDASPSDVWDAAK